MNETKAEKALQELKDITNIMDRFHPASKI